MICCFLALVLVATFRMLDGAWQSIVGFILASLRRWLSWHFFTCLSWQALFWTGMARRPLSMLRIGARASCRCEDPGENSKTLSNVGRVLSVTVFCLFPAYLIRLFPSLGPLKKQPTAGETDGTFRQYWRRGSMSSKRHSIQR